nr:NAD(P)-dependent alcohol dehydrogenase [Tomitella biformata]
MLAVQLTEWGSEPTAREVPVPTPTGTELLIAVGAAGLCRSDLHVMDTAPGKFAYSLPMTLGHEVAGTVVEAGPDADHARIGDSVVVHGIWGCGACRNCLRGRENYCLCLGVDANGRRLPLGNGLGHDGGLAQAMLVPHARHLVNTGDLDPVRSAPLADAGLTAYHAISEHRALLDHNSVCAVVGVGGLGHMAVQILRTMGVGQIVAVDTHDDALSLARSLGAHSAATTLSAGLGGNLADVVFDFVGSQRTLEDGLSALAPGGRLVAVGSAGGQLAVSKDLGLATGWSVSAPFWGSAGDLAAVVDLAQRRELEVTSTTFDLIDAVEVYRELRHGHISGRAVVIPPPLEL